MPRRTIAYAGLVIAVFSLLGWAFMSISIQMPVACLVQIESNGGPVPLLVVLYPDDRSVVKIGHNHGPRPEPHWNEYDGKIKVQDFDFHERRFRLVFSGTGSVLELEPSEDGPSMLIGSWTHTSEEGLTIALSARSTDHEHKNWFLEESPDELFAGAAELFNGRWTFEFESGEQLAQIEIYQWRRHENIASGPIDAEFASLDFANRFFAGRFEGQNIWLASFDDAVPCLITASVQPDGTLVGELTRSDAPVRPFTATVAEP